MSSLSKISIRAEDGHIALNPFVVRHKSDFLDAIPAERCFSDVVAISQRILTGRAWPIGETGTRVCVYPSRSPVQLVTSPLVLHTVDLRIGSSGDYQLVHKCTGQWLWATATRDVVTQCSLVQLGMGHTVASLDSTTTFPLCWHREHLCFI